MSQIKLTNTIVIRIPTTGRRSTVRNTHKINKTRHLQSGYTLIEILVTIAIAGILASIALPTMTESIQNSKTKKISSQFTVATHFAQSEAVKRGIQVTIQPQQTSGNQWLQGWDVFADPNANGTQDTDEELLQTYTMSSDGLTLTSKDSVFASWIGFLPSGAVKGSGGITGGFRICRSDGDITKSRSITIQGSGNIIVEKGTLSCP